MDIVEQETEPQTEVVPQVVARTPTAAVRPKGAYRLADFIIQRTLGTGSFGRVHLGESWSTQS
jgi:protein kinase A